MASKFVGIYMMCANNMNVGEDKLTDLMQKGLQFMVNNDKFFNMLWIQARTESPQFFETQQIIEPNQTNEITVTNFKQWLVQSGVPIDEKQWDSYFFQTTLPDPNSANKYFLVYFRTTGADVLEPAKFIVDYTISAKEANVTKLNELLNSRVSCPACERVIDPAVRASDKGYLTCPFCGQFWTKALR